MILKYSFIFILDIEDLIVISDGNYRRPSIERVYIFNDNNETNRWKAKEVIIYGEEAGDNYGKLQQVVERIYGKGYVDGYDSKGDSLDGWENSGRKRGNSSRTPKENQLGTKKSVMLDTNKSDDIRYSRMLTDEEGFIIGESMDVFEQGETEEFIIQRVREREPYFLKSGGHFQVRLNLKV